MIRKERIEIGRLSVSVPKGSFRERVLKDIGFERKIARTRTFPFHGDRFTAYKRGTESDFRKARVTYIRKYGKRSWKKEMLPLLKGNRLNVFKQQPTRKSAFFVNRVAWSSEQRVRESGKLGKIV